MTCRALLAFVLLVAAAPAEANTGHLHWWELDTTWIWNPLVLVPLLISAGVYATGRRAGVAAGGGGDGGLRLRRQEPPPRGCAPPHRR
jgi:hypothetical protein